MANNILKDKNGIILNPKIPRYEKKIEYLSGITTISFIAKYDCYIDITGVDNAWGYDGGTVTTSISNTAGNAKQVLNCSSKGNYGNTIGRSLVAKAVYECVKGTSYSFKLSSNNSGGSNGMYIIGQIFPK